MLGKLSLILVLALAAGAAGAADLKLATGLGLESRLDSEVNPGFSELREVGQIFEIIRRHPWGGMIEFGYEQQNSASGALHISTHSASAALWGRYAFLDPDGWSPFAALGAGAYFDKITSSYLDERDSRHGTRLMGGLGAGLSKTFWQKLLTEVEVRGSMVEDRAHPSVSFLMRAGFQL